MAPTPSILQSMSCIADAVNEANIFDLRPNLHDCGRAFDLQVFDDRHRVA